MRNALTVHGLLEEAARRSPGKVALSDDHRDLTYADWWRVAGAIAGRLSGAGAGRETVVGVVTDRSAFLPCAFTAVSMIGARFLATNPGWPPSDWERVFGRWPSRLILKLEGTGLDVPVPEGTELLELPPDIYHGADSVLEPFDATPEREVYLNATSASTGQAKIVPTTHAQLLANTAGVCRTMGLTPDDVHLSLFGVYGHPHELFMRGLYLGGRTVLTERRYPRDLLEVLGEQRVTVIMGLPPQLGNLSRLWERSEEEPADLRLAEAGGMHVTTELAVGFRKRTGVDLIPVWGSTETSGVGLVGSPDAEGFDHVVDGYQMELRDADEESVVVSGPGELWIRGPGVTAGYAGDRAKTEEAFRDGWYRTGDMFSRKGSRLRFLGRRGGLIKASGLKVYPLEVELALLRHPGVVEACVVGRDHPLRGEMPTAYIVPRPGVELTAAGIRGFLRPMLDEHKLPRLIHFVRGLPRTAGGKIDRKAIGVREIAPDYRSELLRSDVELVRLLNHRTELMENIGGGFDPTWVDEQEDNAVGHNPGPMPDGALRRIMRFIIQELGRG